MRTILSERGTEILKSLLLLVLVASSVFLSYELWWRPGPFSSLPPALTAGSERDVAGTIPDHIFAPSALIYHDGEGSHRLIPAGAHGDAVVTLYRRVMMTLRPENLQPVDREALERRLIRRQREHVGVTIFLPGGVPTDLWLQVLGATGDFPSARVDRLFFYVTEDPMMLNLYIYTDEGWYETHWTVVEDLDDEGEHFPPSGPEMVEDEASIISRWADHIVEGPEVVGESMVLVEGWRELRLSPLLSIPEVDLQVTAHMGRPEFRQETEEIMSFFSDFTGVRERTEPDGSTIYTDGYRSLRVTPEGVFIYTLINPVDDAGGGIRVNEHTMLREAWSFLRRVMGDSLEDLRLMRVESDIRRGTLDLDEGTPATAGYTFHFSQQFGGLPLVSGEEPVSVQVDRHGVRRAVLSPLEEISELQRAPAETPMAAIEQCYQLVREEAADEGGDIRRIHLAYYPAEMDDGDRIVRPAWFVDLGELGWFVVDAMTGKIWHTSQ